MVAVRDDGRPLFLQIAEQIETAIVDGSLAEETQVPSFSNPFLSITYRLRRQKSEKGLESKRNSFFIVFCVSAYNIGCSCPCA